MKEGVSLTGSGRTAQKERTAGAETIRWCAPVVFEAQQGDQYGLVWTDQGREGQG